MLDKIINYSFGLLFFMVPLIWSPQNFELFEYNKMILTYVLTIIIVGTWILKIINQKSLIFNRTPLDIPILLFLGANIASTVSSIDIHTSIWGYYSRSNGGLLSLISYILLYYAFVSNIKLEQALSIFRTGLVAGFIVAIYGILEHFGVSLSCVILGQGITAGCWVQDVQARVFATLGQPNWMAAYLEMLIFPGIYFFLTAPSQKSRITYYLLLITFYLAFTFTYSRGATLGLIAGMGVFFVLLLLSSSCMRGSTNLSLAKVSNWIPAFAGMTGTFLVINLIFGSALTNFKLLSKFAPPPRPAISLAHVSTTQLENGGTESGKIRLIVWQGAIDIFKRYPLFGSGLETFAYSYYQFRPVQHNLVSEWDFLYNKAHNEFLNYLSTTGIVGFGTYMLMILTFIVWCLKRIMNQEARSMPKNHDSSFMILNSSLLASYVAYLVQNFFGFSVVIIAIFFYLFPAIAFVASDSLKPSPKFFTLNSALFTLIYRRTLYTRLTKFIVLVTVLCFLFSVFKLWYADTLFSKGNHYNDSGNAGQAFNYLNRATIINDGEPYYRSELAYAAASASLALSADDATNSAKLKDIAVAETERVLSESPNNTSFWRSAIRTYFALSGVDEKFLQKTLDTVNHTISLAPSDAKLYYNKSVILQEAKKPTEAIVALEKAVELKPNYTEALIALAEAQFDQKENQKAIETIKKALVIEPNNEEALGKLKEWDSK